MYKTSTYVKNKETKAIALEVKLKSTSEYLQIHHGSPQPVHMGAGEKLGLAYRTRDIRGMVVRSRTLV